MLNDPWFLRNVDKLLLDYMASHPRRWDPLPSPQIHLFIDILGAQPIVRLLLAQDDTNAESIYRVPQEERSIFWDVIVSVILSKNMYMYMYPIPNGFRDKAISLCSTLYTVQTSNTPTAARPGRFTPRKEPLVSIG
jgi:hypothetical protein